ncbi:MAG TPA: helix-turn-helix domain-containing protein [Actinomycetota bacterium]
MAIAVRPGEAGMGRHEGERPGTPPRDELANERLMTVSEVAELMRVSNMTVYRLIKSGQLSALRVGKNYRIREADMDRYLSDRSVHPEGSDGNG